MLILIYGEITMKNKEFKILSIKEESQLSIEELETYYKNLRKYVLSRKLQTTTKGALTIAPKLKKTVEKIAIKLLPLLAGGNIDIISDGQENIPKGAVIFASTH